MQPNPDLPCILIHTYTFFEDYECMFWTRLRAHLNELGFELLLMTHAPREKWQDVDFPVKGFCESLELYPSFRVQESSPYAHLDDDLIERERLWGGAGDEEKWRMSLQFAAVLYNALLLEMNPALLVVGNGEHAVDLVLRHTAKQLSVPHVFLERGPFPFSLHVDKKGITAQTEAALQERCFWGNADQNHWENVFAAYENHYRNKNETWWPQPEKQIDIRRHFNVPDHKEIILFTNQLDSDTSNFLNAPLHETNLDAFAWFCEQMQPYRDQVFIIGKHHPMNKEGSKPFEDIVEGIGVWTSDVPLSECLEASSRVATVNSTVMYESMMSRRPVLTIGNAIISNKNIAYEIRSVEDTHVRETIAAWMTAKGFEERVTKWKSLSACLLSDCLYFCRPEAESLGCMGVDALSKRLATTANKDNTPRHAGTLSYDVMRETAILSDRMHAHIFQNKVLSVGKRFPFWMRWWFGLNQYFRRHVHHSKPVSEN